MSQSMETTTTSVGKHEVPDDAAALTAVTDPSALAVFKSCFGIEPAKPIESAYQQVQRLECEIAAKRQDIGNAEKQLVEAQAAWNQHLKKLQPIYDKGKDPKLNHEQNAAKTALDDARTSLEREEKALKSLLYDIDAANTLMKEQPFKVFTQHIQLAKGRLGASQKSFKDITSGTVEELTTALRELQAAQVDLKKFQKTITDLDRQVEGLCAGPELKRKREEIRGRLKHLRTRPFHDRAKLDLIENVLQDADMTALQGWIDADLSTAEWQAESFEIGRAELTTGASELADAKVLAQMIVNDLLKQIEELTLAAEKQLGEEESKELAFLRSQLTNLEAIAGPNSALKLKYQKNRETMEQRLAKFVTKSDVHKSWNLKPVKLLMDKAAEDEVNRVYKFANERLIRASHLLKEQDARATARSRNQNEELAAKAALALAREEAEHEAEEAAALERRNEDIRNSDTVNALNKIGRDNDFGRWLEKARQLFDSGKISVTADPPDELDGSMFTIEILLTLANTSSDAADADIAIANPTFVVHYHPTAQPPAVGSSGASQMHLKLKKNAAYHLPMSNDHWLIANGKAKTLNEIRMSFKASMERRRESNNNNTK